MSMIKTSGEYRKLTFNKDDNLYQEGEEGRLLPEGSFIRAKTSTDRVYFFCAVPDGQMNQPMMMSMLPSDLADIQQFHY